MKLKFTDRVTTVLAISRLEAIRFRHRRVDSEHILLGVIRQEGGVAATILATLGVDPNQAEARVREMVPLGHAFQVRGELPYTPRARRVLERAQVEARALDHSHVDTEHLLLGLLGEEESIAAWVLSCMGVTLEAARVEMLKILEHDGSAENDAAEPPPPAPSGDTREDPLDPPIGARPLPELIEEAHQRLAALRSTESAVWLAFLDCEDAAESSALEEQIKGFREAGQKWANKLEMADRVASLEAEIQTVRGRKTEAAQAQRYDDALALRDEEKRLRKLQDLGLAVVRAVFKLDDLLADAAREEDRAIEAWNAALAVELQEKKDRLQHRLAQMHEAWSRLLSSLPQPPVQEADFASGAVSEALAPAAAPPPVPTPAETAPEEPRATSSIFISYHRADDTGHVTGRIYDRLVSEFGRGVVFKDVDSIPLGVDFKRHLDEAVGKCAVFLAVVSTSWRERLQNPRDFVRIELEAALRRSIPIIPLFVQNTTMPAEEDLPPSLQPLVYRNGAPIRPDPDFNHDMGRLARAIRAVLDGR